MVTAFAILAMFLLNEIICKWHEFCNHLSNTQLLKQNGSDHCVSVEHCSQTLYMQNKPQRCDHISLKHTSETVPDMLDILDMLYNMLDMLYKPYTDHKLKTYK